MISRGLPEATSAVFEITAPSSSYAVTPLKFKFESEAYFQSDSHNHPQLTTELCFAS